MSPAGAYVVAVASDAIHGFSKSVRSRVRLVEGLGVEGDAHAGLTVRHRSRVAIDPTQPNLRQVHLIAAELLDELAKAGFALAPGDLGENVTTRGIDLLALPRDTRLRLGEHAIVTVTGLRNPCAQIEAFRPGLLKRVVDRADDGTTVRRAGVMGIVSKGGFVATGDHVTIDLPPPPYRPLAPV